MGVAAGTNEYGEEQTSTVNGLDHTGYFKILTNVSNSSVNQQDEYLAKNILIASLSGYFLRGGKQGEALHPLLRQYFKSCISS
jgi:hypothetical protein